MTTVTAPYAERDSTSWDTQSYLYYMGHSVFNHIDAVQEANRLADVEAHRDPGSQALEKA